MMSPQLVILLVIFFFGFVFSSAEKPLITDKVNNKKHKQSDSNISKNSSFRHLDVNKPTNFTKNDSTITGLRIYSIEFCTFVRAITLDKNDTILRICTFYLHQKRNQTTTYSNTRMLIELISTNKPISNISTTSSHGVAPEVNSVTSTNKFHEQSLNPESSSSHASSTQKSQKREDFTSKVALFSDNPHTTANAASNGTTFEIISLGCIIFGIVLSIVFISYKLETKIYYSKF